MPKSRSHSCAFTACTALLFVLLLIPTINAQSYHAPFPTDQTLSPELIRIAELERSINVLQQEVSALQAENALTFSDQQYQVCSPSTHFVQYDDGWILRPHAKAKTPFEFKVNLHNQFRYTGLAREESTYIDSAGDVVDIENRNDFDINRGRLVFSGYAADPRLRFYTNIDYNTVTDSSVLLLISWMSFDVCDALKLKFGFDKVPGTWEWNESSRYTLGAERSLATTFFRPSITAGIWAEGEPMQGLHYRAMIGDGFNTFTLRAAELDTNFVYSGSIWIEPWGDFGVGFSDLEACQQPLLRIGQGFTFARNDSAPSGDPGPEQTVIRLTDGTRLVKPDALAPGVTVNSFDIWLYSVHAGMKYQGFSVSTEYLCRWLTSLQGTGPLPSSSLFDHGLYLQTGYFVCPKSLELFTIGSHITGEFGSGSQVSSGFNWHPFQDRNTRLTFDYAHVRNSPTQQSRTGFIDGFSGGLFRLQLWRFF